MLDRIWTGFFLVAFVAAVFHSLVLGHTGVWAEMVAATQKEMPTLAPLANRFYNNILHWVGPLGGRQITQAR